MNYNKEIYEFVKECMKKDIKKCDIAKLGEHNFNVKKYGSILEINEVFPNKTNVEFVEIKDPENIKMRVWERGTGETLACGTGACASVVACNLNGLTKRSVNVELLGGNLNIELGEDNHVYMTGPAVTVFEGELNNPKVLKLTR